MNEFAAGHVYRYGYLWARERDAGEESGRKMRPACLVFRSSASPAELYLFPITTSRPTEGKAFREINATERRLAGLDETCWIMLDEFNVTLESRTYDFASTEPLGAFSPAFLAEIATAIRSALRERSVSPIRRT